MEMKEVRRARYPDMCSFRWCPGRRAMCTWVLKVKATLEGEAALVDDVDDDNISADRPASGIAEHAFRLNG